MRAPLTSTAPETIKTFVAGSLDSPLSAARMNDMVWLLNILAAMRGENHIVVQLAEGNLVVKLDDKFKKQLESVIAGEGGGGSFGWRGEWSSNGVEYAVGDVVICVSTASLNEAQNAGTFICLEAHTSSASIRPPQGHDVYNSKWRTLARSRFAPFWSYDDTNAPSQSRGYTCLNGGDLIVDFGTRTAANGVNAKLVLNDNSLVTAINGKTFQPREIYVCVNGNLRSMWVLGTEPAVIP
jgi:hypothetical protein